MRIRLLTSLALVVGATVCAQAQASSDDSCYPNWLLFKSTLDVCNNLAFLNPGNDSRVNLRLLLADHGALPLVPSALSRDDLSQGNGPVPFPVYRFNPAAPGEITDRPDTSSTAALGELLEQLGIKREGMETAGDVFLTGEGSRCRSNSDDSAKAFISQLVKSPELSAAERQVLARSRMQMLNACSWESAQQASLLPSDIQSVQGKAFVTYLQAAGDFYSGRFAEAGKGFAALADSSQPWLKETALYMTARTALNSAQQHAFDQYGVPTLEHVDKTNLQQAESAFQNYLTTYPTGDYAVSAKGLLRRVHWLGGDPDKLAEDYAFQLTPTQDAQRNVSLDELVNEVDTKLLTGSAGPVQTPLLLAVNDLMRMRDQSKPKLTLDGLQAQKAVFAQQPALYDYLQAAFALYVDKSPDNVLKLLPSDLPSILDYLAFSQQTLRGLALETRQDWKSAEALWLQLLPLAKQPLQHEQLELALAMNYERSQQLAKVFADDSPIKTAQVRYILLRQVADAPLLRQQVSQGLDATERNTALFVLLYKDLLRSQFQTFADDLELLPATPSEEKLASSLGYVYTNGQTLKMFQWKGDKAESGYACPSIVDTAATLQSDGKNPQGLNCLGEFILRNSLDGMPLEQRPNAANLGGTAPAFKGEVFSRLDGYQQVIGNAKAPHKDRAYALFRAINCYAPSGYNSCGGKDVAPAVRKDWFRQLKTGFADTTWGKSLQYYW